MLDLASGVGIDDNPTKPLRRFTRGHVEELPQGSILEQQRSPVVSKVLMLVYESLGALGNVLS
jgi:hypothetical protein